MTTLRETAENFVPKQIKNVADLPSINIDAEILFASEAEFPYHYIEINGEEYKVPDSVIRDLKNILAESPLLKTFKVKKSGEGLKTRYTVIPIH